MPTGIIAVLPLPRLVGAEKAKQNPNHRGDEEYNYFMAVCFPANQLTIIDYNRVVKDSERLDSRRVPGCCWARISSWRRKVTEIYKPNPHCITSALYLDGKVVQPYCEGRVRMMITTRLVYWMLPSPPTLILDEVLGIKDLRSDKRIDFVGGIRGLGELK